MWVNPMADQEEIAQQLELLRAHRATLAHSLKQQALLGAAYAPPAIAHSIATARAAIARCKAALRGWGVAVEDLPGDDAPAITPAPVAPAITASFRFARGTVIKSYSLRGKVAEGGFGTVYRAEQLSVGRDVAIKVIRREYTNLPEFIRRFEAEAQIVARLEHPHIVPLYDYWRDPTGAYLVMRWMSGGSLLDLMRRGPIALDDVATMFDQIASALALAHRRGVVHRDLKPANILRDDDGHAYLADFGIAKDLEAGQSESATQRHIFTPGYAAPEQILVEPVTPQADLYSLGVMLYELLAGARAFSGATPSEIIRQQLYSTPPRLHERRPELPEAIDEVIARAIAADRAARYPDVPSFAAELRAALASGAANLHTLALPTSPITAHFPQTAPLDEATLENPYKGLRAFQEADALDFFGRDALIERLVDRLGEAGPAARFLAVVGPSGSGKSSLVRAGLVPRLRAGALPGSDRWFIVQLVPGARPLEELEAVLLRVAVNPPASLLAQLVEDERGLLRAVNRVLPADEATELVMVIDQFEELFTLVEDEATRAHFLSSLLTAVLDPRARLRVVVTLRADFFDRPLQYAGFGELIRLRTNVVLPLAPAEIEEAIVAPAARAGAHVEPDLVAAIVQEVAAQPGALPLLQYALTELFEQRQGRRLTLSAYRAGGGVLGALARRADTLDESLDERGQLAARQLCLRLVNLGEGTEDTRRRMRRGELIATTDHDDEQPDDADGSVMEAIIELYGRYRLLTFDYDPITREPTVEVAHEALIRSWERLRAWLHAVRDDIRIQRRLAAAAAEWLATARDPSYLASGTRLEQLAIWARETSLVLNADERAFLEASLAQAQAQRAAEEMRHAREQRLASEVHSLALTFGAQEALKAGNADLALALALAANQVAYPVEQAQLVLGQVAYAPRVAQKINGDPPPIALTRSPDHRLAVLALSDRSIKVRNLHTGTDLLRLRGHALPATCAAYSADGRQILTGAGDATVCLWDMADGQEQRWFRGHKRAITCVAFGPHNTVLSGSEDQTVRLWDAASGQERRRCIGHRQGITTLLCDASGRIILTASEDRTIRQWEFATGRELGCFEGHADAVTLLALSPNGHSFASAGKDHTVRVWHIASGQQLVSFHYPVGQAVELAYASSGRALTLTMRDGTSYVWDLFEGAEIRRLVGHTAPVWGLAISADGRRIASASGDRTIRLWNLDKGAEQLACAGHADSVTCVALSADGHSALSGSNDASLRLWNLATGAEIKRLEGHGHPVLSIAFSPDGRTAASGSADKTLRLWDLVAGRTIRSFVGHSVWVVGVAFSPDGTRILSGSSDRTLRMWETASGAELCRFTGHTRGITSVALSADGRLALSGSEDGTIRVWDADCGAELQRFTRHAKVITSVAFSPDGRRVISGSTDGVVQIWDVETGLEQLRFSGHTAEVLAVAWSADGRTAISGSRDTTIRLWRIDSRDELLAWTVANRHVPELTPEQRQFYRLATPMVGENQGTFG
jgi:WD40 repeat protein